MSTINNLVIPENFAQYVVEQSVIQNPFYQSGVLVTNNIIQEKASSGGTTVNLPFFRDLGDDDPNLSTDTLGTAATAKRVTADKQVARISNLNQGWESADLAGELAGADPITMVKSRYTEYWARVMSKRLIASSVGIKADSVANHDSDMVITGTGFTSEAITKAVMSLGDNFGKITSMGVHSAIFALLVDQVEANGSPSIEYRTIDQLGYQVPVYRGMMLIVDDMLPVDAADPESPIYTSVFYGQGAFSGAYGMPKNPVEVERKASDANGAGSEALWSRVSPICHPNGYKWTEASVAGQSPVLAELSNQENWGRVSSDRKHIAMAFLETPAAATVA